MRNLFRVTAEMRSMDKRVAAAAYARAGLKVLGLHGVKDGHCTCGRPACSNIGKHPFGTYFPNGHLSATTNEEIIDDFFRKNPDANIGIVPDDGLIVIDIDGDKGEAAIAAFDLPQTASVTTGRGHHHYFRSQAVVAPKLPSVDYRQSGAGYVVAPPSLHRGGKTYVWGNSSEIADLPRSFGDAARTVKVDFSALSGIVQEGGRNTRLTSIAGLLRSKNIPFDGVYSAISALNQRICVPPLDDVEVRKIARSVSKYPAAQEDFFGDMDKVIVEPVHWLYEPYIPLAALTMLDGDPGLGKSNFGAAITAAVTKGRLVPWSKSQPRGRVLVLSAEDDPGRVQKPRLDANSADATQIRYATELFSLDEKGIELLRSEIESTRPLLVIIDPIIAFIGPGADLNKATDMTRFLTQIDQLAREFDCAIVIVRHLRKAREGGSPLHQGMGSIAIAGRVRSMLVMGRHPDDDQQRAIAHTKSNYGKEGPTIIFALDEVAGVPVVRWLGVDADISGADLTQPELDRERGRPPNESREAIEFLRHYLRDGERDSADVYKAAGEYGVKRMTLRRVADRIIEIRREGRKSYWRLKD